MPQLENKKESHSCVTHRKDRDLKNTMDTENLPRIAQVLTTEMLQNFQLEMKVKRTFLIIQPLVLYATMPLCYQLVTNPASVFLSLNISEQ